MEKLPEHLIHEVLEYKGGADQPIRHDTILGGTSFIALRMAHTDEVEVLRLSLGRMYH